MNFKVNSLYDLEKLYPHRLQEIIRWFKFYKTYDGKKANRIHFDDKILNMDRAIEVIHENHESWKDLREVVKNSSKFKGDYGEKLLERAQEFHMDDN